MAEAPVLVDVRSDGVAEIVLNRAEQKNSMSRDLLDAFTAAVIRVRNDPSVRVVVVSGRGRHFCSGAALRAGPLDQAFASDEGTHATRRSLRAIYDPFLSVLDIEVPTIAAIQGAAIGGGLGLALACDLRIAADDARLQANFVRLGIHPGMGVSWFVPHLVGAQRAADLLFTGRAVSGREAAEIGLVLRAVPAAQLESEVRALAKTIAESAPEAVRLTKQSLRRALGGDPRAFADTEALAQAHCLELDDAREGVLAWTEKRTPAFRGK